MPTTTFAALGRTVARQAAAALGQNVAAIHVAALSINVAQVQTGAREGVVSQDRYAVGIGAATHSLSTVHQVWFVFVKPPLHLPSLELPPSPLVQMRCSRQGRLAPGGILETSLLS